MIKVTNIVIFTEAGGILVNRLFSRWWQHAPLWQQRRQRFRARGVYGDVTIAVKMWDGTVLHSHRLLLVTWKGFLLLVLSFNLAGRAGGDRLIAASMLPSAAVDASFFTAVCIRHAAIDATLAAFGAAAVDSAAVTVAASKGWSATSMWASAAAAGFTLAAVAAAAIVHVRQGRPQFLSWFCFSTQAALLFLFCSHLCALARCLPPCCSAGGSLRKAHVWRGWGI